MSEEQRPAAPPWRWLAFLGLVGAVLALVYPDGYQQDGGNHYLFARWAWEHPRQFVDVWGRPLFTVLYFLPSQLGYPAAKLFTVAICVAAAWQTWRLAVDLGLRRAGLAVPLLFLQTSWLHLCSDTMTEPLFALVFIVALRLHRSGRVVPGALVASLMALARPEGFFLGILWGLWILLDRRDPRPWWRRLPTTLLLASGTAAWWLVALLITGDPLWILHNWPRDWSVEGGAYGVGTIFSYLFRMPEIFGVVLMVPFALGLVLLLRRRRLGLETSAFLVFIGLHTAMFAFSLFNSGGYARYFVAIAPATALIVLEGWNEIADRATFRPRLLAGAAFLLALAQGLWYVDGWGFGRDARAVKETVAWLRENPVAIQRLCWSQTYSGIALDRDPSERIFFGGDPEANVALLRESPPGTLVLWDGDTGPAWHRIGPAEIERAGYRRLRSKSYVLDGYLVRRSLFGHGGPRRQEMHLFYKD